MLLAGCLGFCLPAGAQETVPDSVLFIGNSFTLGSGNARVVGDGGVPGLFAKMAATQGMDNIQVKRSAELMVDWGFHLAENSATRDLIASRSWDVVVIQDVSTAPGNYGEKPLERFFTDGKALAELIRQGSPDARIIVFQPWSRHASHSVYRGSTKFPGGPEEMQEVIDGNVAKLAEEIGAQIAPVGDAFLRSAELFPDLNLYMEDWHHANANGCYLAAAVFFAKILGLDPTGADALGHVSEDDAKKLQQVAWSTVSTSAGNKTQPAKP
jgi:hypothetical protein